MDKLLKDTLNVSIYLGKYITTLGIGKLEKIVRKSIPFQIAKTSHTYSKISVLEIYFSFQSHIESENH